MPRWEKVGNYLGTFKRTLDEKHRLQVPAKLVGQMPARFYAIRGHEGCLAIFDENDFNGFLDMLKTHSYLDRDSRAYVRQITASTNVLDVDSHGRISIPTALAEAYGLGNEVTIIGALDHFEIFGEEAFRKAFLENEKSFDDLAQSVSDHNRER